MKVLLVNGSPHKKGCTNRALEEVAKVLEAEGVEAEIFWIGNEPIGGCVACGACSNGGTCAFGGSVVEFQKKAREADGYIFGSPVHYASASGNMTAFMDRLFFSESRAEGGSTFRLKPGAVVCSARRGGTTAAFDQLNKWLTISEMPVVSSRYWNMVHGSNAEQVEQDEEGLWTMRALGRNMAYLLKCQEAARAAGIELPEREAGVFTNFIR
ncbi:MAG: flavodoxin family protein [Eggerthellaceae bacterium]|nr:flavodoxin family protein [Eggerthellaceae bacterium]